MKTTSFSRKITRSGIVCAVMLTVAAFSGCAQFHEQYAWVRTQLAEEPDDVAPKTNTAPALSKLTASPNPAIAGKAVTLTAKYGDPEADLLQGLAAISINGAEPITMAFRSTYPSGLLTLSVPISSFARASDLRMALKICDDSGNWSNLVSTVVTVE